MPNSPKGALPLLEAFPEFYEGDVQRRCQKGEWLCWARRGVRDGSGRWSCPEDAAWTHVPTSAWPFIRILGERSLCHQEPRERRVEMLHPETRRKVLVSEGEQPCTVEMWFDPVFAPGGSIPPVRSQRDRNMGRKAFARWAQDKFGGLPSKQVPNRTQMLELARAELGDWVKPTWIKELKPPSRAGRRKSGGK